MSPQPDAAPGRRHRIDGVVWQQQNAHQWCWAACCVMIAQALGVRSISETVPLTQCGVFAVATGRPPEAVCQRGSLRLSGVCDRFDCIEDGMRGIDGVVSETLDLLLKPGMPKPVSVHGVEAFEEAEILAMVDRGWPVAVLCELPAAGGGTRNHYVLIIGYDTGRGEYLVWDPAPEHGLRRVSMERWYEIGTWVGAVALRDRAHR